VSVVVVVVGLEVGVEVEDSEVVVVRRVLGLVVDASSSGATDWACTGAGAGVAITDWVGAEAGAAAAGAGAAAAGAGVDCVGVVGRGAACRRTRSTRR